MTEKPLSSEAALRVAPSALFVEWTWIEARSGARMNVEDPQASRSPRQCRMLILPTRHIPVKMDDGSMATMSLSHQMPNCEKSCEISSTESVDDSWSLVTAKSMNIM